MNDCVSHEMYNSESWHEASLSLPLSYTLSLLTMHYYFLINKNNINMYMISEIIEYLMSQYNKVCIYYLCHELNFINYSLTGKVNL